MHTTIIEPNQTAPTETPKRYQCRHIFTDGHRCGSPSLRSEPLCYYHHTTRKPASHPRTRRGRRSTFELPLPEDRSAIQHSIGQVLQRIAANDIDPRRAGLLLYGLQIASLNLPKQQPAAKSEPETVEEITTDPELGLLAPPAEVGQTTRRKSTIAQLLDKMLVDEATRKESAINQPAAEPAIVPTLQATEEALAPQIDIDQTGFHVYRSHRRVFRGARALGHAAAPSQAPVSHAKNSAPPERNFAHEASPHSLLCSCHRSYSSWLQHRYPRRRRQSHPGQRNPVGPGLAGQRLEQNHGPLCR